MRTTIFKFLFAITALAVVSCDEWNVEIDTQIMRDGSCVRTVKSDNNGCLTEDDGWTVVETKDSSPIHESCLKSDMPRGRSKA